MFQNIKQLYGKKLGATDGEIGHVKDFYFDDKTWVIRYLVADTDPWLPGRQVLLSPHAFGDLAFGKPGAGTGTLLVNLTRKQIENSPPIDSDLPVSRQYEEEYYRYYGLPAYWMENGITGPVVMPVVAQPSLPAEQTRPGNHQRDDHHLRSTKALIGYAIQTTDGPMGTVASFMMHPRSWAIRELVVETGHWYSGKEILLLPENIDRISYEYSTIFVRLTSEDFRHTATNDVAQAGAGLP